MFSDVVLLHGENGSPPSGTSTNLSSNNVDKKNICSSEKMTQTGKLFSGTLGNVFFVQQIQIIFDCFCLNCYLFIITMNKFYVKPLVTTFR